MDSFRSSFTWVFGISFIVLMFPITILIWFLGYPFDPERRAVHRWLLFQGRFLSRTIPIWKLKIEGLEKISGNHAYVIISNHQSILDIILLNNIRCDFRWVSKVENFRVPILGPSMKMAKYISIERGNKESALRMMAEAVSSLERNISIMMFPEGTRSKSTTLLPFKTGAFQMALKTDKPILPVVIDGTGMVLPKKGHRFRSGNRLVIKVLDPVYPGSFGTGDAEELAAKFRDIIVAGLTGIHLQNSDL
ncbi:MAG: 1-acyl-sn-glycerol-3-phosphate acyltransferase [Bacteroidales bacterium]|jgi:1-acyl-sn-glycerol-3-phosphate acyltransferase|nr:1-acyl-sn-glycerol-3-phosphate acyltransferase [Bacteroidales bacterium]